MHTEESILPSSRKMKLLAIGIPCLLVLYVLCIGPTAKLADQGMFGESANKILRVAYAPLGVLGIIPGMERIYEWYIFDVWNCDSMTTR